MIARNGVRAGLLVVIIIDFGQRRHAGRRVFQLKRPRRVEPPAHGLADHPAHRRRATWYAWRAGGAISRLQRMGLACELSREIGYGAEL